ncbi:MAG: trigger factor [Acholeplasmatales bacterium]|nr:trigger factor [Acholeplasmatales bacterium]
MKVEKLENSQIKFVFDVTADEFEKALDKAFEVENKKVTIPGFRAGKAPRSVFEKNYGVEALYNEALGQIYDDKIQELVKAEEAKSVISQPQLKLEDTKSIERGKDFKIALVADVYPEVTLPNYKGLEVAKKNLEVTDDDVMKSVQALAEKDSSIVSKVEQVIAKGDYAVFDFDGSVDGVPFDGGKAENYELEIGSGQFIPGFEDQMIGMKSDESKDIKVTFPENYHAENLAGKEAVFKVLVHEVKVKNLPEFTDEYVKSLNVKDVNTLDELKASKRKELEEAKVVAEKDRQTNEVINKLLDSCDVKLPQTLIDERVNAYKSQYEEQAKMYKIPFETFIQLMGATMEQFNDVATKQATRQALFEVVAGKIIEVEKLNPTKEQIEAKAEEEAKKTNANKDDLLKANAPRYLNDLAYDALVNLLLSNAKEI